MTRREKALNYSMMLRYSQAITDYELALVEEYEDLLAFYDAAIEDGLAEAYEQHVNYVKNQVAS